MRCTTILLVLVGFQFWLISNGAIVNSLENVDWWQKAVFYQIFPRSFKDSDNDGIGDIPGIIQKLDHFVDAGVDAIWLSPIYKSPMVDGGYDISDYRDIAPEYGTLDDFKKLLEDAHERKLKVVLDFVPNHSSDQHIWFKKSINKEEGYNEYYLWADAKYDSEGNRGPPNNWLSVFQNSGWTWNEQRGQYFFHQFTNKQPDLNLRSKMVQKEMKDIMTFWLNMGVDGFRVDAVPHIYEDEQLRDEPIDPNSGVIDPNNYDYLKHIYTKDQPKTFELVYDWRNFLDNYTAVNGGDTRIFMTEAATNIDKVARYYGTADGSQLGAHFSFNFYLIGLTDYNRPMDIKYTVDAWQSSLPSIYTLNWLTGNHDNHRVASRVSPRNIDGYNMMVMFLPGISITYMGEEFGQEDGEVTCEQGQDPSAVNNCTTFNQTSRDFERTPYQWDDSINAGFNEGAPTWLPVSKKYKYTNLENQREMSRSHYKVYQQLIKIKSLLRSANTLTVYQSDADILQLRRSSEGGDNEYFFLFNMGEDVKTMPIQDVTDEACLVLVSSVDAEYLPGDKIFNEDITLKPGDSFICKLLLV
ncbi:unnamed protein product [Ceutorhynchus assimilis]|uniref:alpha-glucosidase n=1 Tax=Ceutorhynchus assimilis TaxID=467358 RepID=A0A9N9MJZ6_9CUCU|nr:unnamed protein product [Ceutorhynchus assimilis]